MPFHAQTMDLSNSTSSTPAHIITPTLTHANPTKLVSTLLTRHMASNQNPSDADNIIHPIDKDSLAPSIFLNRALALTTLLRVTLDPIRSLAVVPTFFQPHLRNTTHDRSVIPVDRTPETKQMR
jgi:hypothetical protein